jgi:regulatory protein
VVEHSGSGAGRFRRNAYGQWKAGGAKRSTGAAAAGAQKSQLNGPFGDNLLAVVSEAEVVAVEAHPKYPAMYRVAIRLHGESGTDVGTEKTQHSSQSFDATAKHWNDEVDALIAGAAKAAPGGATETVISVHEDTLVSLRLLKGRRLSAEEWEALRHEEDREDAYRAALTILERKARTSRELSEALKRKGYAPDIIQSCLNRLQERRILDDSSYARRFAEQRATGQRKGRRLIRQELLQRGIAKEDADLALGELDENIEREAALTLARKKWPQWKGELRDRQQKLAAFLLRRGYPNSIVKEALEHVTSSAPPMGDQDVDFAFDGDDLTEENAGWDGTDPDELS